MQYEIKNEFIMLCEGAADNACFRELIRIRALPEFDFPFPPEKQGEGGAAAFHGRDGFVNMLSSLNSYFALYPEKRSFVRGVVIASDAGDRPTASFRHVLRQIEQAGEFGLPEGPQEIAHGQRQGHPQIAVLLVPCDGRPGGVETLCAEAVSRGRPDVGQCVDRYFECGSIDVLAWPAEKRDKARLACMIAAINRQDPTRALQYCFSSRRPIVDVRDGCFSMLADAIRDVCARMGRAAGHS